MDAGCLLLLYCIGFNFYINLYFYNNFRRFSLLFSVICTSIHCIHGNVAYGDFHDHIDVLIFICTQNKILFKGYTVISNIWYSGNTKKAKKVVNKDYSQGLRRSKNEWWRTKNYLRYMCMKDYLILTCMSILFICMYVCCTHVWCLQK